MDNKEVINTPIKDVFVQNIIKAGLRNRVFIFDGDSCANLCMLLRSGQKFDFIYVDGSHMCLDVHNDLILAWEVLRKYGIMGIDDYPWQKDKKDALEVPFHAVNHFLEKYRGEYEVLHCGYRIFLKKMK